MKNFNTPSEREILALAISLEEDERVDADSAECLKQDFPEVRELVCGVIATDSLCCCYLGC
jgi:hypothetical protein